MTERAQLRFVLNGRPALTWAAPWETLLAVLRDGVGATEVKYGCGEGVCGTCTVLLDGVPVNACLVLGVQAAGRAVTTVKGLNAEGIEGAEHVPPAPSREEAAPAPSREDPAGMLHPLQRAFIEHEAAQCGFCTPGMLLVAHAFLRERPHATRDEIRAALAGNLCRCTGYARIVDAVEACAKQAP